MCTAQTLTDNTERPLRLDNIYNAFIRAIYGVLTQEWAVGTVSACGITVNVCSDK